MVVLCGIIMRCCVKGAYRSTTRRPNLQVVS
jgi:hypothetical protein